MIFKTPLRFIFIFFILVSNSFALSTELPVTGTSSTLCDKFNKEMLSIMRDGNYKAGTFSLFSNDREYCSNGYGYDDASLTKPIDHQRKMRLASIGKPITAILIKNLFRRGLISPDTQVFKYLNIKPYNTSNPIDPQVSSITVQNLLDHKSGWDKKHDGYAKQSLNEIKKLSKRSQPSVIDISKYMVNQPLQYPSGTKRSYSNYGYGLLKEVVVKATGESYVDYLAKFMKKHGVDIIRSMPVKTRDESETWYEPEAPVVEFAFAISATDLAKIFTHYWISGDIRENNNRSYTFYGSWDGTTAVIRQKKKGITYSVLLNTRGKVKNEEIKSRIDAIIDQL